MLATFAVWLLILLPVGQQLKPVEKNDTAHQHTEKASASIVLSEEKHSHDDTAAADNKKRAAAKSPVSPVPQQSCPLWVWMKSRSNADLSLIVNALYLLATVGILLAMLKSNKHAEETYKQSKTDTETSLQLTRDAVTAIAGAARAWITVDKIRTTTTRDGIPDWVRVTFKNTGHSPAINAAISGFCIIDIQDIIPGTPGPEEQQNPLRSNHTVGAGGKFTLDIHPQMFSSEELRTKVAEGNRTLYVLGGVRYYDVFNPARRHILQYAAKYDVGFKHWVIYICNSD